MSIRNPIGSSAFHLKLVERVMKGSSLAREETIVMRRWLRGAIVL